MDVCRLGLVGWLVAQVDFLLVGFVSPRVGFGWRRLSVGDLEEVTGDRREERRRTNYDSDIDR